ncbi:MAG TPA: MBL fold metallo-hydrolase, partial [Gaiellaceae bacterium]|nr:MBL fold metallo-hydrolase [Gaiellaceae bacterium]
MRIHKLTTGRVRGPRRPRGATRYLRLEWSDSTLPVNAFLVEHDAGLLLVDTGQGAAAAHVGFLPRWHPFLRIARFELAPDDEAAAQIERLGFDTRDVRTVVLTHLHTDHVGGVSAFAHADVLVSEREWRDASGVAGRVRGYVPRQWPRGLRPQLVRLAGGGFGPFAASHELEGFRGVTLVSLPGHTRGHVGVLAGSALVGGDAAHDPHELEA